MHATKHSVSILIENRPDLLSRAVSLLHRRAFQVENFSLGHTESERVARLTIVVRDRRSDPKAAGQRENEGQRLARELRRLVNVIRVDVSTKPSVARHHALVKIAADAENRPEVLQLCEVFRAHVVDVARKSVIVELTGEETKMASFLEVVRPFGIVEMVCGAPVSLGRAENVLDSPALSGDNAAPHPSSWFDHRSRVESTHWN